MSAAIPRFAALERVAAARGARFHAWPVGADVPDDVWASLGPAPDGSMSRNAGIFARVGKQGWSLTVVLDTEDPWTVEFAGFSHGLEREAVKGLRAGLEALVQRRPLGCLQVNYYFGRQARIDGSSTRYFLGQACDLLQAWEVELAADGGDA